MRCVRCPTSTLGVLVFALVCGLAVSIPGAAAVGKIDVCHVSDEGSTHIINIPEAAFETHQEHGDQLPSDGETNCDDGIDNDCDGLTDSDDDECSCPCFTAQDLLGGTISQCGENFPGFSDLAGVKYTDGRAACSGANCAVSGGRTCAFLPSSGSIVTRNIDEATDAICRVLIMDTCDEPNSVPKTLAPESERPFASQEAMEQ